MGKHPRKRSEPSFPHAEKERLSRYVDDNGAKSTEREIDAMAEDSFPASDPPSFTGTHIGGPKKAKKPLRAEPTNKSKQAK